MAMATRSRYGGVVAALLALLISWSTIAPAASSIPRSISASSSSSSSNSVSQSDTNTSWNERPPWNPSIHINNHGYLRQLFQRIPAEIEETTSVVDNNNNSNYDDAHSLATPVLIRQVPGDGDCLFHSLAIALSFTEKGKLMRLDTQQGLQELKESSRKLRTMAVECLASSFTKKRRKASTKRYKRLFIQGSESIKTSQLLSTASSQYGISPEEYCELMMQDSYWGGGPEIVSLCAVLRRPIHLYELIPLVDNNGGERGGMSDASDNNEEQTQLQQREKTMYKDRTNNQFCLRLLATFGSPKYDTKQPLYILSADSRFPDVDPHCALKDGNHFLALFPVDRMRSCLRRDCHVKDKEIGERTRSDRKQRVRGGDSTITGMDCGVTEVDNVDDVAGLTWLFYGEWYDDLPCDIPPKCELDSTRKQVGKRSWFSLEKRRELQGKEEEDEQLMSVYRPKYSFGYWINVFVRLLAYCGHMI